jgi:hypothetical protein
MTKKSRYFLLILGFIVFLVLAPLIVFYVRGLSFNFQTHTFSQTGILSTSVDPSNAQIYLNNKVTRTGSGDIKFLAPAEYEVSLRANGYQNWNKRLLVQADQVTWASPAYSKVYLFLQSPKNQNLGIGVSDFYAQGNNLLYLQNNSVVVTNLNNLGVSQNYPLPKVADSILGHDDAGTNFILTNSASASSSTATILLFNLNSGLVVDLSALFTATPKIQFSDGNFYALSGSTLYQIDIAAKKKTPLFHDVNTFYFQENYLYFLKPTSEGSQLLLSQAPYLISQVLMDSLPKLTDPQIFVTFGKQIFVLSNNNLYLANSAMQEIASGVTSFDFNSQNPSLPIFHNGELDYYDTLGQTVNFITRSSSELKNPVVSNSIDYALYSSAGKIYAAELDQRGTQNTYILYSGQNVQKFNADNSGKNILLLDNGQLEQVTIR